MQLRMTEKLSEPHAGLSNLARLAICGSSAGRAASTFKTMSESEAALIYRSLAASVTTYPRIADVSIVPWRHWRVEPRYGLPPTCNGSEVVRADRSVST
jgi:hypothetical protein